MPKPLRMLVWLAISVLGAGSVAVSALHKGESINALWLVVKGLVSLQEAEATVGPMTSQLGKADKQ